MPPLRLREDVLGPHLGLELALPLSSLVPPPPRPLPPLARLRLLRRAALRPDASTAGLAPRAEGRVPGGGCRRGRAEEVADAVELAEQPVLDGELGVERVGGVPAFGEVEEGAAGVRGVV